MASNIDNTVPAVDAALLSEPIRNNFIAAKSEIEALQGVAVTNGNSHDHNGGDGAQIAYSSLSGLPTLGTAAATASTDYAPAAKGVTNGDSHDHNGGDGAQIAYSSLSGLPTLPSGAIVGTTDTQTLSNKTITGTKETVFTITDGGSVDINPNNGGIQLWTLGASRSPTASSFAAGHSVLLMINDGSGYAITWPSVTWISGSAPILDTTKNTCIELWKTGTTLWGSLVGAA